MGERLINLKDYFAIESRTQMESRADFSCKYLIFLASKKPSHNLKTKEFLEIALAKFLYQHGPGCIEKLSIGFFDIMHTAHLITRLVKFLRKMSKIKGDKNFSKRGEVNIIKFRPLITILLILMAK